MLTSNISVHAKFGGEVAPIRIETGRYENNGNLNVEYIKKNGNTTFVLQATKN